MQHKIGHDARQVANWFIERARKDDKVLPTAGLLKLLYISHGWHLETQDGAPLFSNRIEAWQAGPVTRDVFAAFNSQGVHVKDVYPSFPSAVDRKAEAILEDVWQVYGDLAPFQLTNLTRVPGGPWDIVMKVGGRFATIPDELTCQHFQRKRRIAADRDRSSSDCSPHEMEP